MSVILKIGSHATHVRASVTPCGTFILIADENVRFLRCCALALRAVNVRL